MNTITRGQIWVARSLIPLSIGVAALGFIVLRPFEKKASASPVQRTMSVPVNNILAPGASEEEEIRLEPITIIGTLSKKPLAHIARKSDTPCWSNTPGSSSKLVDTVQGPVGQVLVTTCR